MSAERPFLIGITGPIGCGKSTVAQTLADLGGTVVDADALARQATGAGEPTLGPIRQRFGDNVFRADGTLDRAALGRVVFDDPAALSALEQIVHPAVRRRIDQRLEEAARERAPFVVIEAIKLVEGGIAERCDEVWLVECLPTTQRHRLAERKVDRRDAEQRMAAQGEDLAERLAAALEGRVRVRRLATEGTIEQTQSQVEDSLADALAPLVLGD